MYPRPLQIVLTGCFYLAVLLTSSWLCLAIWVQQPLGSLLSRILIVGWWLLALVVCGLFFYRAMLPRHTTVIGYFCAFALGLLWFFTLPAKNNRQWHPEVAKIVDYQQQGHLIRVNNIRNFHWRTEQDYDIRWDSRLYDLSQLESMDVILSYWTINQIAHTLVSFNFKDGQHLAFSIETRKESDETFSTLGGFFRKYELAIIAADEKDIIYTRSNIRKERVYIYPLKLDKTATQELFISYLNQAKALKAHPRWYNTLFSNCTTIIFDMVNTFEPVPTDYRILLSGLLPHYLYEQRILDPDYTFQHWTQMAHINPKTQQFEQLSDQSSQHYSQLIRSGLPH